MTEYKYDYLIIGAGLPGAIAAQNIGEIDSYGTIGIIGSESDKPYKRPPLTKSLWTGRNDIPDIFLDLSEMNGRLHLGTVATKIDRENKKIKDNQNNTYQYEKLLLATGGTPKKLPNIDAEGIIYYRTLEDFKKVRELVDKNKKICLIGAGFIGSELIAGIKKYNSDSDITMIFPESGISALRFPNGLSSFLNEFYREKGIKIENDNSIRSIEFDGNEYSIETENGKNFTFDAVVAGIGITPNIQLAEKADLQVKDGIIVDKYLQTSDSVIYAAGDVARFRSPLLNEKVREEHVDNAFRMGEIAGKNMAGKVQPYEYHLYYLSKLFKYKYEAIGVLDSNLNMVEDWVDAYEKGVVYYLDEERVKGILIWNMIDKIEEARSIIEDGSFLISNNLIGKIR